MEMAVVLNKDDIMNTTWFVRCPQLTEWSQLREPKFTKLSVAIMVPKQIYRTKPQVTTNVLLFCLPKITNANSVCRISTYDR